LWQDGLTSPQLDRPGNFKLIYDGDTVAEYDGAVDGPFVSLSFEFGQCGSLNGI
jgi:hypothetical protein